MKILIADDYPFTLQGTKSFVESYGYSVTDTCSNGTSALNLILLHLPDIAILDIIEPPPVKVADGQIPPVDPVLASYRRRLSSVVLS